MRRGKIVIRLSVTKANKPFLFKTELWMKCVWLLFKTVELVLKIWMKCLPRVWSRLSSICLGELKIMDALTGPWATTNYCKYPARGPAVVYTVQSVRLPHDQTGEPSAWIMTFAVMANRFRAERRCPLGDVNMTRRQGKRVGERDRERERKGPKNHQWCQSMLSILFFHFLRGDF